MEDGNHLKSRIKARRAFNKKIRCKIRLRLIKEDMFIWLLFLSALLFPIFPFANLGISVPFLHPCRVILDNVCYGYIAGVIFYLFSDFRPKSYRKFKAKQHLASMYVSIHLNYFFVVELLGMIDNEGHLVDDSVALARQSLLQQNIDDDHIAIREDMISKVKAMLCLVDKEIDDLLQLHNSDLEDDEIMNINRFRNLFDKLRISNLYDYVTSNNIIVTNNDLELFLSSLGLNYKTSKRLKEQYSVYKFDAVKFDIDYSKRNELVN